MHNGKIETIRVTRVSRWDGCTTYMRDGLFHREDGPAVICDEYTIYYHLGVIHRDGGPAIIHADGTREWMRYGRAHREDGPAIEHPDGAGEWWFYGFPQEQLNRNRVVGS